MNRMRSGAPRPLHLGAWDTGTPLPRSFYEHSPEIVAPRLLGKILVHRVRGVVLAGRIVEAEAYLGPHHATPDPAAHAHRGPTPRNSVLFGLAGHAYVYSIYGQYFCMNVSCEPAGCAGCVLLRALEPVAGVEAMARNRGLVDVDLANMKFLRQVASGPSRLCQALGLARATHNGLDVTSAASALQILDGGFVVREAAVTPRIGIKHAVDWLLRFSLPGSAYVSGPRNFIGDRIPIP